MNRIDNLLVELHKQLALRPAIDGPRCTSDFRVKDSILLPEDFARFINGAKNEIFTLWNEDFDVFTGVSELNLNEWFAGRPWEDTRRDEYEKAFMFAGCIGLPIFLGLDLSTERLGWIFYYYDHGHGVSLRSGFLFRSVEEFLTALLLGDTSEIEHFAPMIAS